MKKKGNLFKLIKSLSKSEKRYVKIFVKSQRNESNYFELLNFIDKQANYNENEIKKHFYNKNFIKQIHVTKTYLTQLILKALQNFHAKSSIEIILLSQLQEINLLFQKNLFNLAENIIEKTLKTASDLEYFTILIQALEYKRQLLIQKFGATEAKKEIAEIINQQNLALKEIFTINEYYELTANFFDYFKASNTYNPIIYSSLDRNPLFLSADNATSLHAKALYYHLHFSYQIYKNKDFEKSFQSLETLIHQLELHPNFIQANPQTYLQALNNQISLLLNVRDFSHIPTLLQKVRQTPEKFKFSTKSPQLISAFFQTYTLELDLYLETQEYDRAERLIDDIEEQLEFYHSPLITQLKVQFYYQFALIHFLNKNLIQAGKYLKQLYEKSPQAFSKNANLKGPHPVLEKYFQAKFLELFIYLKQEKIPLCRNVSDQLKIEIRKERLLKPEEKALLQFFSRLEKRYSVSQLKQILQQNLESLNFRENLTEISWLFDQIPEEEIS